MNQSTTSDLGPVVLDHHVTDAAEADINQMPQLLHGDEREVYGDRAYWSERDRRLLKRQGVRYRVNRRATRATPLPARWHEINRSRSRVRARGEHSFRVVKRLWGFSKTRYRGLAKNETRAYAAFGLANLYMLRTRLLPRGAECVL